MNRADSQFLLLLDRSAQGVLVHRHGKPLYANKAFADLLRLPDVRDVLAIESIFEHFRPETRKRAAALHEERIAGAEVASVFNHPLITGDGETIWIESRISTVEWDGAPAVCVMAADITERHRLETQKDEFASTVSHELRTPLSSISGALSLLQAGVHGPLNERQGGMVDIALANAERMTRLVDDILKAQASGTETFGLQTQAIPIADVLHEALRVNQPFLAEHHATVSVNDGSAGARVMAAGDQLIQVLTNLISNAVRYADGAPIDLNATVEGEEIVVTVADGGPGIPEEMRPRLFTRFGKGKEPASGSGLGLYICRQLVEAQDGTIDYRALQPGSAFVVRLPKA